jgi:acyl-coenzyme A synthetase/AMP-(fatty) acid ligase
VSRYGILLQVRFVTELIKTSVGKLNKRAIRESILGQLPEDQSM